MSNQLILNLNTENDSQTGSLVTLTRLSSKIIAFFFCNRKIYFNHVLRKRDSLFDRLTMLSCNMKKKLF